MVKAIVVDKTGEIKAVNIKMEKDELYKKCKLKSNENFDLRHTWKVDKSWGRKNNVSFKFVSIFAKNSGRANMENKYDLPPPVDNDLYFGSMVIVGHDIRNLLTIQDYDIAREEGVREDLDDSYLEYLDPDDISVKVWTLFYEELFGGFEALSTTALQDELEEDELEKVPEKMKTKTGYLKDDFVVDDDDDLIMDGSYEGGDSLESESEFSLTGDHTELEFEEYEYSDEDKLNA